MDFCTNDTPWGEVDKVQEVLNFLAFALGQFGNEVYASPAEKDWGGLFWILEACSETLKQASEQAQQ